MASPRGIGDERAARRLQLGGWRVRLVLWSRHRVGSGFRARCIGGQCRSAQIGHLWLPQRRFESRSGRCSAAWQERVVFPVLVRSQLAWIGCSSASAYPRWLVSSRANDQLFHGRFLGSRTRRSGSLEILPGGCSRRSISSIASAGTFRRAPGCGGMRSGANLGAVRSIFGKSGCSPHQSTLSRVGHRSGEKAGATERMWH